MSSAATIKLVFNNDIRRISVRDGFLLEELNRIIHNSFLLDHFVILVATEQNHQITNQAELQHALSSVFAGSKPNLRLIIKQTSPQTPPRTSSQTPPQTPPRTSPQTPLTFSLDELASMLRNASTTVASNAASSLEKVSGQVSSSFETLPAKFEEIASVTSTSIGDFANSASSSMGEASKNISSSYDALSTWFQQIIQQIKTASDSEKEKLSKNLSPHFEYVSNLTQNMAQNIAPTVENVQIWFCETVSQLKEQLNTQRSAASQHPEAHENSDLEEKLRKLEELGFGDRLLNQYLLESNDGDLEACIQQFLE